MDRLKRNKKQSNITAITKSYLHLSCSITNVPKTTIDVYC